MPLVLKTIGDDFASNPAPLSSSSLIVKPFGELAEETTIAEFTGQQFGTMIPHTMGWAGIDLAVSGGKVFMEPPAGYSFMAETLHTINHTVSAVSAEGFLEIGFSDENGVYQGDWLEGNFESTTNIAVAPIDMYDNDQSTMVIGEASWAGNTQIHLVTDGTVGFTNGNGFHVVDVFLSGYLIPN